MLECIKTAGIEYKKVLGDIWHHGGAESFDLATKVLKKKKKNIRLVS